MQVIERWSGHVLERRTEKPRRECGRRHKRCPLKVNGGGCDCGLAGKKYYKIPTAYLIGLWSFDMDWIFKGNIDSLLRRRQRINSTARKWGRKRAWRMLAKVDDKIGRMEYL